MHGDPRAYIAGAQAAFLDRLGGLAEAGAFDAREVRVAGVALARKRMRSAAKAWPRLAKELGAVFAVRFAAYSMEAPWPPPGGPLADGWLFARWLGRRGELGEEGTLELAACELRARWNPETGRLVFGRRLALRVARLPGSGGVVVGVRLFGREWWWRSRGSNVRGAQADGRGGDAGPSSLSRAPAR